MMDEEVLSGRRQSSPQVDIATYRDYSQHPSRWLRRLSEPFQSTVTPDQWYDPTCISCLLFPAMGGSPVADAVVASTSIQRNLGSPGLLPTLGRSRLFFDDFELASSCALLHSADLTTAADIRTVAEHETQKRLRRYQNRHRRFKQTCTSGCRNGSSCGCRRDHRNGNRLPTAIVGSSSEACPSCQLSVVDKQIDRNKDAHTSCADGVGSRSAEASMEQNDGSVCNFMPRINSGATESTYSSGISSREASGSNEEENASECKDHYECDPRQSPNSHNREQYHRRLRHAASGPSYYDPWLSSCFSSGPDDSHAFDFDHAISDNIHTMPCGQRGGFSGAGSTCRTVITPSGVQIVIGQDQFSLSRRRPDAEARLAALVAEDEAAGVCSMVKLGGYADTDADDDNHGTPNVKRGFCTYSSNSGIPVGDDMQIDAKTDAKLFSHASSGGRRTFPDGPALSRTYRNQRETQCWQHQSSLVEAFSLRRSSIRTDTSDLATCRMGRSFHDLERRPRSKSIPSAPSPARTSSVGAVTAALATVADHDEEGTAVDKMQGRGSRAETIEAVKTFYVNPSQSRSSHLKSAVTETQLCTVAGTAMLSSASSPGKAEPQFAKTRKGTMSSAVLTGVQHPPSQRQVMPGTPMTKFLLRHNPYLAIDTRRAVLCSSRRLDSSSVLNCGSSTSAVKFRLRPSRTCVDIGQTFKEGAMAAIVVIAPTKTVPALNFMQSALPTSPLSPREGRHDSNGAMIQFCNRPGNSNLNIRSRPSCHEPDTRTKSLNFEWFDERSMPMAQDILVGSHPANSSFHGPGMRETGRHQSYSDSDGGPAVVIHASCNQINLRGPTPPQVEINAPNGKGRSPVISLNQLKYSSTIAAVTGGVCCWRAFTGLDSWAAPDGHLGNTLLCFEAAIEPIEAALSTELLTVSYFQLQPTLPISPVNREANVELLSRGVGSTSDFLSQLPSNERVCIERSSSLPAEVLRSVVLNALRDPQEISYHSVGEVRFATYSSPQCRRDTAPRESARADPTALSACSFPNDCGCVLLSVGLRFAGRNYRLIGSTTDSCWQDRVARSLDGNFGVGLPPGNSSQTTVASVSSQEGMTVSTDEEMGNPAVRRATSRPHNKPPARESISATNFRLCETTQPRDDGTSSPTTSNGCTSEPVAQAIGVKLLPVARSADSVLESGATANDLQNLDLEEKVVTLFRCKSAPAEMLHDRKYKSVTLTVHAAEGLKPGRLYRRNGRTDFLQRLARRRDRSARPQLERPYIEFVQNQVVRKTEIGRADKAFVEWHESLGGFTCHEPDRFFLHREGTCTDSVVAVRCYDRMLFGRDVLLGEGTLDLDMMTDGIGKKEIVMQFSRDCGQFVGSLWITVTSE